MSEKTWSEWWADVKPKVSIGICLRNSEATVRDVISSLVAQDFPHELMEVVFVDDGSTDKTLSVIQDSVSRMDMETKVFHTKWRGLGPARNTVVKNAAGDYILWVDGDTVLPKDYVGKQVEYMEKHQTVGLAKGKIGMWPERTSLVATLENSLYVAVSFKYEGKSVSKLPGTCGAICRVSALKQVGGFDEHIRGAGEDTDVAQRIRKAGWQIYITPAVFYDEFRDTWKALWKAYYWYGYSLHVINHKHKGIIDLPTMTPPVASFGALLNAIVAYKLIRRKSVFLLPFHSFFKMSAWCLGFAKSHVNSYGH